MPQQNRLYSITSSARASRAGGTVRNRRRTASLPAGVRRVEPVSEISCDTQQESSDGQGAVLICLGKIAEPGAVRLSVPMRQNARSVHRPQ